VHGPPASEVEHSRGAGAGRPGSHPRLGGLALLLDLQEPCYVARGKTLLLTGAWVSAHVLTLPAVVVSQVLKRVGH
jgi:hypothetical protein